MDVGEVIAKRYRVERLVGRGGAAEVYEVTDEMDGRRLALKRLGTDPRESEYAALMFAREYNALAQLSHPLIIRAFDYGVDDGVPYYTMELLEGESLRGLSPLPWREACTVLRDVASALGIIHSRRLVHRDVTTRNVYRSTNGRGKLIDFGALTPMGPIHDTVGTPPFVAPEAVDEQRVDGRADLFALGAVAYFALTGEHAYPARTFRELGTAWRSHVKPPSAFCQGIPPALDELVLSLLSLVRTARPQHAAEVFERLTAIADLPSVEAPEVAQAYLSTPSLVARSTALGRFSKSVDRVRRGRGSALFVLGERGLGRSRLLGAFVLEAKLRGLVAVRVNGRDSGDAPFATARRIARALYDAGPREAAEAFGDDAAFLESFVLRSEPLGDQSPNTASDRLSRWVARFAGRTALVIGVDDAGDCDDQSLATFVELAGRVRSLPIVLVFTGGAGAKRPILAALRRASKGIALEPLTARDMRALVSSLFGDVPHVETLAEWIHRLTSGNPGMSLVLAQHLVDRGVATYRAGTWALPASLAGLGLPETVDQALEARFHGLGPDALRLLQALALMTDHEPLLVTEYPALGVVSDAARLFDAMNELISASILVKAGATYVFSHERLAQAVRRTIPDAELPAIHLRLARAYSSGSGRGTALVVHHLFHAGKQAEAFRAAALAVGQRIDQGERGSSLARSRIGAATVESLFEWGIEKRMPRTDLVLLGRRLLQLASVRSGEFLRHLDLILEPLRKETGLVYWDAFADIADPAARMHRCVGRAYEERERAPVAERGLDPVAAIGELATSAGMLIGVAARNLELQRAVELRELISPLRSLSPAVDVVGALVSGVENALRGYWVLQDRLKMLERVSAPVHGLDELSREGIWLVTLFYIGLDEAVHGREGAVERIAPLDAYAHYVPLAWEVRMLAALFSGDGEKAAEARRRRDAAAVGRADIDQHLELSLLYEAAAYSLLGDILGLKRVIDAIAEKAARAPGWAPYLHLYRGSYHAQRGDLAKALEEHERAFALLPGPGRHDGWAQCVHYLAGTLIDLDQLERAEALSSRALAEAEGLPIQPHQRAQLEMSLALARASLGETDDATRIAARAVDSTIAAGTRGVMLVEQYNKQALVALEAGDRETFRAACEAIETMAAHAKSSAFAARHAYLLRRSRSEADFNVAMPLRAELVTRNEMATTMASGLRTELNRCANATERAHCALGVLLDWSAAEAGFLYVHGASSLSLAASSSGLAPPDFVAPGLAAWVRAFIAGDDVTQTVSPTDSGRELADAYDTVGLVAHRVDGPVLAAVAALSRSQAGRAIPESVLDVLGEGLLTAGDAVGLRCRGQ